MKLSRRRPHHASLSLERLEDRWALAGNVIVERVGASDLKITGSDVANDIAITLVGPQNALSWHIAGNNTTVQLGKTGQPGAFVDVPVPQGLFRNVTIDLKFADPDGS